MSCRHGNMKAHNIKPRPTIHRIEPQAFIAKNIASGKYKLYPTPCDSIPISCQRGSYERHTEFVSVMFIFFFYVTDVKC